jgi:ribosome-binding factor A
VLGEEEEVVGSAAALESAKGLIRSEVAKQLGLRHAPTLEFIHDALPDTARHFEEILAQTREADAARAAAAAGASYAGEADPYRKPHEDDELDDDDAEASIETPGPSAPQDTPFETPRTSAPQDK